MEEKTPEAKSIKKVYEERIEAMYTLIHKAAYDLDMDCIELVGVLGSVAAMVTTYIAKRATKKLLKEHEKDEGKRIIAP